MRFGFRGFRIFVVWGHSGSWAWLFEVAVLKLKL